MKMTHSFPTDKHGQVYYGPKTLIEAVAQVDQFTDNGHKLSYAIEVVAGKLMSAGYRIVAARLHNRYR